MLYAMLAIRSLYNCVKKRLDSEFILDFYDKKMETRCKRTFVPDIFPILHNFSSEKVSCCSATRRHL